MITYKIKTPEGAFYFTCYSFYEAVNKAVNKLGFRYSNKDIIKLNHK